MELKDFAIVDYDSKQLILMFSGEKFTFDLTLGDIGEFWHGFGTQDGTIYDVNFYQEEPNSYVGVSVYGTMIEEDGMITIDSSNYVEIDIVNTIGNQENYFSY
jgi:hypothetical protein